MNLIFIIVLKSCETHITPTIFHPEVILFYQYKIMIDLIIWKVFCTLDDSVILCQQDISHVKD